MFDFHDMTQFGRVYEFALNLRHFQIPPRIAPNFSFGMSMPVFNFYAPFAYWVSAALHLLGMNVFNAVKLSFLLSLTAAYVGMFMFLRKFFSFQGSLIGAVLYAVSPWFAIEIFIRGNLGEAWFLALLPWAFYLLTHNSQTQNKWVFLYTSLVLFFTFSVHNVLSLLSIPLTFTYILLLPHRIKNSAALVVAVLLASYFLLPALFELPLTYATEIAKSTRYSDHFLCVRQLWTTPVWNYGGSMPGCIEDGMSFMLGKIQVIAAILASTLILFDTIWGHLKKKENKLLKLVSWFMWGLAVSSILLTLYASQIVWEHVPILRIMQFPWRFLALVLFGIAFINGYFFNRFKLFFPKFVVLLFVLFILFNQKKFFTRHLTTITENTAKYLSKKYFFGEVAYNIPEYFPKTGDYAYWRTYDWGALKLKTPPVTVENDNKFTVLASTLYNKSVRIHKKGEVVVNIHYFPYWRIAVNSKMVAPHSFDKLGRPLIQITKPSSVINIYYKQTPLEQTGNAITLVTFLALIGYTIISTNDKKITTPRT